MAPKLPPASKDPTKLEPATLEEMLARPLPEAVLEIENAEGVIRTLHLRAIKAPAFEALLAAHPPISLLISWNPETFQPALVSACLQDPIWSPDECRQVRDAWPQGVWMSVFGAAIELCLGGRLGEHSPD